MKMTSKKSAKDDQKTKETEFVFDIEEMREQLGIDALELKLDILTEQFTEWLLYVNMLDERQQRFEAEPILTAKHKPSTGPDGRIEIERHRPPLPDNLLARGKVPTSPKLIEQG
jgi:hypothetical protein